MDPILTICTVSKGGQGLSRTIKSIMGQNLKNVEIILILRDVEITDNCDITKLRDTHNSVKILLDKCTSLANAANLGILNSTGKYIYFLDGGDYFINSNSLNSLVRGAEGNSGCLAYSCIIEDADQRYIRRPKLNPLSIGHVGFVGLSDKETLFDETLPYSSDHWWIKRQVQKHGCTIISCEPIAVFTTGGVSTNPDFKALINVLKFEKYSTKLRYIIRFCGQKFLGRYYNKFYFYLKHYEKFNP